MSRMSLEAFEAQLNNNKLTSDMKRIVEILKTSPQTIDTLMFRLNMKYSTASGRTANLHELGYLKYNIQPNGGQSWITYVSDEKERDQIRKEVAAENRKKWIKKGLQLGCLVENESRIDLAYHIVI